MKADSELMLTAEKYHQLYKKRVSEKYDWRKNISANDMIGALQLYLFCPKNYAKYSVENSLGHFSRLSHFLKDVFDIDKKQELQSLKTKISSAQYLKPKKSKSNLDLSLFVATMGEFFRRCYGFGPYWTGLSSNKKR